MLRGMVRGLVAALAAAASVAFISKPALAGMYTNDFSTGVGAATLNGNAAYSATDGTVHLTEAVNGQAGTLILPDLDPGQAVKSFTADFDVATGPGTSPPADGISFNFGKQTSTSNYGEEGINPGIVFEMDTYNNTAGEAGVDLIVNGAEIVHHPEVSAFTNGNFVHVHAALHADGTADFTFNGTSIASAVATGYTPAAGDLFGFGGRTGGLNEVNRIDNVSIATTVPEPAAVGMLGALLAATLLRGRRQRV